MCICHGESLPSYSHRQAYSTISLRIGFCGSRFDLQGMKRKHASSIPFYRTSSLLGGMKEEEM